ncbi:NAD(+) synthetase [Candidatus Geothermarchaeota archaeon]|nr:MAG: NAD(+) synthetase [Candidatus Geothermarchaeota archaeon]HEW93959.1 NAD+ synthase [Thermoprotei archaeon]
MKTIIPPINYDYALNRILSFLREKLSETGLEGLVIGLSGGVDSSVTAAIAVKALGSEKVHGLILPDSRTTPREDIDDAIELAEKLNIKYHLITIDNIYDTIINTIPFYKENDIANGNVRARIRMIILYYYANVNNLLVCGTGDKSEILLGYFTKYGDGGVDMLPIGDLYKTQVRIMGKRLGLPEKIYLKPSSPRLWPGQTAENELGISYEIIDTVLYYFIDQRYDIDRINMETGIPKDLVNKIINRVFKNEHKRMTPLIPKIGGTTINNDWKMPYNAEL